MKKCFVFFRLLLITIPLSYLEVFPQDKSSFELGIELLAKGDTSSAIKQFERSGRREKNPEAYFFLSEYYSQDTSVTSYNTARLKINKAIKLNPDETKYYIQLAELLKFLFKRNIFDKDGLLRAEKQYKTVLEIDETNAKAHLELGKLYERDYYEFLNSLKIDRNYMFLERPGLPDSDLKHSADKSELYKENLTSEKWNEFLNDLFQKGEYESLNYSDEASEFFIKATYHFEETIKHETSYFGAYIKLAMLYNNEKGFKNALRVVETAELNFPENQELLLVKAHTLHKLKRYKDAHETFNKAFELMSDSKRYEYKISSVLSIVHPNLKDNILNKRDKEKERIIDYFWKIKDPLNLTKQNERLLEHYSRMVYANYQLSNYDPYIHGPGEVETIGWKTERGNIYIRYGEPKHSLRMRADLKRVDVENDPDEHALFKPTASTIPKTDIWDYGDYKFSFIDKTNRKNFELDDAMAMNATYATQYSGDSKFISDKLLLELPNDYIPKFEGPTSNLPFNAYQFKGVDKTDIYINYGINDEEIFNDGSVYRQGMKYGVFLFDKFMNPLFELRDSIKQFREDCLIDVNSDSLLNIHSIHTRIKPNQGNFAFEIIRNEDKGVFAFKGKYVVRNFSTNYLSLSDVVLASKVKIADSSGTTIKRGNYHILPNPVSIFSEDLPPFLYFEIYNLRKGANNLTNFEQNISFREVDEGIAGDILNSALDLIGFDSKGDEITLSSNYSTPETNSQIYVQLDLNNYDPGEYVIDISIKDNITGEEVTSGVKIYWY